MLPPVLEVYVVWHPDDSEGAAIGEQVFAHFHGTTYSGLIGGAIEVYKRSDGWSAAGAAPRHIPFPGSQAKDSEPAHLVAIVPVIGNELAAALQNGEVEWTTFVQQFIAAHEAAPERVGIFPVILDHSAMDAVVVQETLGKYQWIGKSGGAEDQTSPARIRDLAQGVVQMVHPGERLQVFVSHTKRATTEEEDDVNELVHLVRDVIGSTRLRDFFDARDLQPGQLWDDSLRNEAARSAMLVVRTDLYSSREWCQREVRIAKLNGMPIVSISALTSGEERGSFLLDHMPRIPVREDADRWRRSDIERALNLLVDECLKRALWRIQHAIGDSVGDISWWAPHAPEPITLTDWLETSVAHGTFSVNTAPLRILHPDPPLGAEEKDSLEQLLRLCGHSGEVDILTPRLLAARGA